MKWFLVIVAASCLAIGVVAVSSCGATSFSDQDIGYAWRVASGPQGKKDAEALPLYEAIVAHDRGEVSKLLKAGTSPNRLLAPNRWSPLQMAIYLDDRKIIDELIKDGANLNYISNIVAGETPLVTALSYGVYRQDLVVFYTLIDKGADINLGYGYQRDIASLAATLGQMRVVNELLRRGYRRDISGLKRDVEMRIVDEKTQGEKIKALQAIDDILSKES